ncbi:uncharacterized protein LOC129266953 [Lytechinus pictus]|uniref:uncharacterized protein LOC129266953 n=1 Tax=Lytechinus pictus TaxID=7653 RepID=UPI0030B9E1DC
MCCLPFAEKPLPEERMPIIVRVHLFDDITGRKEMVIHEEHALGFAHIHPSTEVPINVTEEDVTMTCVIDDDRVGEAIVKYDDLWRGKDRMRSFNLDLTNQPDRVVLNLQVGQEGQHLEELLCLLKFTYQCRLPRPIIPHDLEQLEGAVDQTTHQEIPETTGRVVTNGEITKLSRLLPDGESSEFCEELGFDYNYTQKIKTKHLQDSTAAFKEVLQEWKNRGGLMVNLDTALKNSDLGGLICEYKK